MTTTLTKIAYASAAGAVAAIVTDLHSFINARKADPKATYDWGLAAARWALGALTGAATGAGIAGVG